MTGAIVVKRKLAVRGGRRAAAAGRRAGRRAAARAPPRPPEASAASHPGAVKSPMVGTVFLSPEPGASPFVAAGARVKEGDTLLIIEAMKVMNPIAAPRAGTVKRDPGPGRPAGRI